MIKYPGLWFPAKNNSCQLLYDRAVGRSENPGVPVLFGGHNLPPLVEIGLTDMSKFGGAMAPPAPPGTTGLYEHHCSYRTKLLYVITISLHS